MVNKSLEQKLLLYFIRWFAFFNFFSPLWWQKNIESHFCNYVVMFLRED